MNLQLKPTVLLAPGDEGYLAYELDAGRIHRLNPLAAVIVELADGSRSRDEIIDGILPLIGAGGAAGATEWIEAAQRQGLLLEADAAARVVPPTAAELRQASLDLRAGDLVLAAYLCQRRAVELDADDPQQWYRLGEMAHIVGRRTEARAAYERYLQACPDDAEVEHLLIALRGDAQPQRASDACIERIYGYFASFYERNMCEELDYRAPALLSAALLDASGRRRDLAVLDAGCGTGLLGNELRSSARRLVGIDLSADMIALARSRGIYDALERAELTTWFAAEPAEAFDVIGICDTLIYFGDLRQVIPAAVRHLAPGGFLGFTVEKGDRDPHGLTDSGRFTHHRNHLVTVAAEAGCEVVSQTEEVLRSEYGEPVVGWLTILTPRRRPRRTA